MLLIGSHVSFKSNTQLLGSTKEALSYGENTFMFYTGAPQNTKRSKIDDNLTNKALKLMKESNIDIKNVIVHAPYIINLANDENKVKFVELNLIYLKNDFSISQVAADCNAVLKNYVNVTTPKNAIAEAKNNSFYYYNDSKSNIKVSYLLANTDKKYYTLKVIVGL